VRKFYLLCNDAAKAETAEKLAAKYGNQIWDSLRKNAKYDVTLVDKCAAEAAAATAFQGFGAPSAAAPQASGFGAPAAQGFGAPPAPQGFGAPPAPQGFGAPAAASQGFGVMAFGAAPVAAPSVFTSSWKNF